MENRVIRFRAWNIQQKKFIEISALDFHRVEAACVQQIGMPPHFYPTTYPSDENILMQFTWIKDKNGVDVYEGDLVKFLDGSITSTESGMDCDEFESIGEVYWSEDHRWDVSNRDGVDIDEVWSDEIEVIGNIYQNKELLT